MSDKAPLSDYNKFTGFHVSEETDACIRLYALKQNIPIAQVHRAITRKWIEDEGLDKENLIQAIAEKMKLDWEKRFFVNPKATKEKFFRQWNLLLKRKVSDQKTIDQIIKTYHTISDETNKGESTELSDEK